MLEQIVPDHGEDVGMDDYLDYYARSTEEERLALTDLIRSKIQRKQELTEFETLFLEKNTDFFHADDQPSYGRKIN
jgi:hypothetical protein